MSIASLFMKIGSLYLIFGICIGVVMSVTGDHSIAPLHAHINLLGFVLMMVFGLFYHLFPAAGLSRLAKAHFWLHLFGGLALLVMLGLLLTGRITEAGMVPVAPVAELAILLGILAFVWNVWQHAR